ncbi:MAG: dynamin family protein [Myxococcota bacterium]
MLSSNSSENDKALNKIIEISENLGIVFIERDCKEVVDRLMGGRFNIVFLGQFKRGKSTLINAFLGRDILPYGVVPVTAIVSVIRYGEVECCLVKMQDGTENEIGFDEIYLYATQKENPDNKKGVEYIEIRLRNDYLKRGLFLVDTPGISSISESNTMVTKGFLQNIDTAVIVLGVDPPISYDEFEVIREIKKRIKEIIFVINKVDKEPVEDIEAIRKFTTDILKKEFNLENPVIFCVSAKERFEGRNSYDWNNFVHKIDEMLLNKRAIISDSYKNAIDRLTNQLKDEIDRYIQVLKEPIEKSREKVVLLNEFKKEADIFIRELGYRFQSEQDRISQLIDLAQKKFLDEKKDDINNEFESAFDRLLNEQVNSNGSYYNEIHKIAEKYVNQCIERISGDVIRYYSEFSRRYAEEINRLESKIKSILNSELSVDDSPNINMYERSEFYFHHFMRYTSSSPLKFLINIFLPKRHRIRVMKGELKEYLDWLIYANCSRYNGDINQRIIESRRRIEADFKRKIDELIGRVNNAVIYADRFAKEGESRIKGEIYKLLSYKSQIEEIRCFQTQV